MASVEAWTRFFDEIGAEVVEPPGLSVENLLDELSTSRIEVLTVRPEKIDEKIVREHADAENKEQMFGNVDRVLADVRKLIGDARELDKTVRDTLHEYKERKKMQEDQKVLASFIWDLRHTVEQEVKRRTASKLPLSPDKRLGAPSYRKRWKLVSDVLNYWFRYTNKVGNLIPYSETAVRKFANRYKDHYPSDSP